MRPHFFLAALLCALNIPAVAIAQSHPPSTATQTKPSPKKTSADYSREPFVITEYATIACFENDGTGEQILTVRIRVQSDAGAKQLRELVFAYNSSYEQIDVRFVRVHKSDGTVVTADADAAKDVATSITRDAPAYADAKEKHIAVPALAPGDELEYEIATRVVTPRASGEFWYQHSFLQSAIVLDERLEINLPETRKVALESSAGSPYETSHENGRTIYRWKHANLTHPADDSSKKDTEQAKAKPPDVQLTTFATWGEVARWYAKLEADRADPTPEIRAKTQEIIQGSASDLDKTRALYDYVSTNIRYVSLPFGESSYQPRSAADVLSSKYGDAKDEHTLLAAMLKAAGIDSDAVLIPSVRKLIASLPSPAQFDHVITAVPLGNEVIWMDTTAEVAPFRLLASPLRNKSALLVPANAAGRIVQTPADPPFLSTQHVDIDGQVSDLGKLTALAHYSVRGDTELVLRIAFRRTPQSQWKDLGQTILTLDGIHGEVTDVKPGDPAATRDPFTLDIAFSQPNFLDWSSKKSRAALPLLAIGLPDVPSDAAKSIELGSPLNVTVRLKLALPAGLEAQPPIGVSVARDYAEFKSSYRFADHMVTAERSLDFKMRRVPASRADDYSAFSRAVASDENQLLAVTNTAPGAPAVPATAQTDDLLEAGLAALNAGNTRAAIPLFERAVQLDPQHKQAWNDLGLAYLRVGKNDEAASAFQKQLKINPADEHANDYLGLALERQQKLAEAAAAFRRQTELNPLDLAAHAALGEIFLAQHDYVQAAPELDKATILSPDNAELRVNLGRAYLNTNEKEKALVAFKKAVELSPTPLVLNDIAYNLADGKTELDLAQHYAESAIASIAADVRGIDMAHLTNRQLNEIVSVAGCWDTLGWVSFQKGDLQTAERYINAAWLLDQDGEIGDHLAQIHDKLGEKDRAIHAFALALAAPGSVPDTRARLTLLLGGNSQIDDLVSKAKPELAALRTIPAGKLSTEDAQADFFVLLSPGEKQAHVDAVRFAGGSEKLRPLADRLRSLDYGAVFPDASPMKLVRRGTLTCSSQTGDCTFTLIRPENAHTQN
ncbi:MAG: DUF3857 domain-containing protein [Acidobacteriia bacterium]|nr:DUF3857 domain-containing protein [Terriglobia bacterium]